MIIVRRVEVSSFRRCVTSTSLNLDGNMPCESDRLAKFAIISEKSEG